MFNPFLSWQVLQYIALIYPPQKQVCEAGVPVPGPCMEGWLSHCTGEQEGSKHPVENTYCRFYRVLFRATRRYMVT